MKKPTASGSILPLCVLAAILAGGATLLVAHARHYPLVGLDSLDPSLLTAPDPLRLLAMLRTLSWLALVNAAAWCSGALLEARLPVPASLASLRQIFRLGIGLALMALAVLLLASLHLLVAPAFAVLLVAPPAAWGLRCWLRRGLGEAGQHWPRPTRTAALVLAGYALLLVNAYLQALGENLGWDALTYHLAFPARYLDDNGIVMTPFSHLSGYIASTEMLYLLALALDEAGLAVLVNFEYGLLILAVVWIQARQTSFRAAALAPLILLADPLFQMELGWAYTDLSLALYTTLAAIALHAWLRDRNSRMALVYAGIFLGISCATRYLAASFGVALVALIWLPPRLRKLRENLGASVLLAALSIFVMAPFMIRNAVFTGNPIAPLLQALFHAPGAEYIPPIVMEQSAGFLRFVGMGRDLPALLALPWNLVVESVPGTYAQSFGFQVGPLYVVGLLAALLVADARRTPAVASLLKLVAVFTLIWFYSFQEARFLVPALPSIAIIGAVGIDRAADLVKPWGRLVLLVPLLAALYCQLGLLWLLPADYASVLGSSEARPQTERPVEAAASFLRGTMHGDDKLMLWLEERAFHFRGLDYIPYHIGSGSPSLHFVHGFRHGAALQCGLQDLGVTHLLINQNFRRASPGLYVEGYGQKEFIRDLDRVANMARHEGRRLFEKDGVEVYGLPEVRCD